MRKPKLDLTHQQFGRLRVLAEAEPRCNNRYWLCVCDCGQQKSIQQGALTFGTTLSCGCLGAERRREANTTHGLTHAPEYWAYWQMHQRCENPNDREYRNYGARGIAVCKRWSNVKQFVADMGPRPSPHHSLERINNNKGYTPTNCRWATPEEQSNNKRGLFLVTHNGETKTVAHWARKFNLPQNALRERLRRGWSFEGAITTPFGPYKRRVT